MIRYKLIVLLNSAEGKDEEFNEWFDTHHLPDALKVPGFVSGQRFRLAKDQREGASRQWTYLTEYEVETADLKSVIAELSRRLGTPAMRVTDSIAPGGSLHFFEPLTDIQFRTVQDAQS
ncbi:DUF4286 family protein [Caballeronia sp. GAWG2-1]|uniref:DUF4286 family protein n=1 Tax=Caballeronia sp. GAWG2-1 TaxID=2921744 RepID=UPI0020283DB1|nr:DUF4286 family protein [Caballeronia sp. GAWG2-1]